MKNLAKIIVVCLILVPFLVSGQTGKHVGEQKFLNYLIEYSNEKGVTEVNEGGVLFLPYPGYGSVSFLPTVLPVQYLGEYPLYFSGQTMDFCVTVSNTGSRVFKNLKVEAVQEFLNSLGGEGEVFGESSVWHLDKLGAGQEIELCDTFNIPFVGESGIDQTHLIISHYDPDGEGKGEIIIDDPQAGLWCPVL